MTHSKLTELLTTHEIQLCIRNSEGKEEWFQVDKIDKSKQIEDYRIGRRIYNE